MYRKKYEGLRPELNSSGQQDIDATLTTRELAYLIRKAGIDFASLPDGERDSLMGESTGGATIFGVTGGVMEAALRFAYQAVTGIRPDSWDFKQVRGLSGLKEYTVTLNGTELRLAVVHGAKRFAEICDQVKAGNSPYHFIEFMACPGDASAAEDSRLCRPCSPRLSAKPSVSSLDSGNVSPNLPTFKGERPCHSPL